MKILAIVSLGKGVGSGHYGRTIKLINHLKEKKSKILFILNKKEKFKKLDNNFKFDFENFKNEGSVLKKILDFDPDLIILDSYILSYSLNKKIYKINENIISIDDNLNKRHICKYYINYNFIDKNLKEKIFQKVYSKKKFIGPKYFFSSNLNLIGKKFKRGQVLIFLGSTNENKILEKVLSIFNNKKFNKLNFKIILGSYCKVNIKSLKIKNFKIYKTLPQKKYLNILSNSEFFITSGGVSVWEGLIFKKKMIVISTANNQLNNLKNLKEEKIINYVGKSKNFNHNKNKKKIFNFFSKRNSNIMLKDMNKFKIGKKFKELIFIIKKNYET